MINILSESMMMNYKSTQEFSKDFKKLFKKYKTLKQDLDNFKGRFPEIDLFGNKNFAIFYDNGRTKIIKARFFCRYLKGKTLRIIFAYYSNEKIVEFIEIYFKGNKEREDQDRIKEYLKTT